MNTMEQNPAWESMEGAWMNHMLDGEFEQAWRITDAVLRRADHIPRSSTRPAPVWRGEPFAGKRVLVRCLHGLGDTIQFVRYAPHLAALGCEVTVAAQPELVDLLGFADGVHRVLNGWAPLVGEWDVEIEVMELPYAFRTTLSTIPASVPYLTLPARRIAGGRDPGFSVGVLWRGGEWDTGRSIDVRLLEPLAGMVGISLRVLQRGPGLGERPPSFGVVAGSDDVLELAHLLGGLDLIVSVDTMVAHLAGALGRPTWILLRADADWRWLRHAEASPWYPSVRLFRQPLPGDWATPVERVVGALAEVVQERGSGREVSSR